MSKNGIIAKTHTKVQQHMKEETDINNIVNKYANGIMPANAGQPIYMDLYNAPDFHKAQNLVAEVNQNFQKLPSALRYRFQNSPEQLIKFVENKANLEEAIKLGLVPKPESKPTPVAETPPAVKKTANEVKKD